MPSVTSTPPGASDEQEPAHGLERFLRYRGSAWNATGPRGTALRSTFDAHAGLLLGRPAAFPAGERATPAGPGTSRTETVPLRPEAGRAPAAQLAFVLPGTSWPKPVQSPIAGSPGGRAPAGGRREFLGLADAPGRLTRSLREAAVGMPSGGVTRRSRPLPADPPFGSDVEGGTTDPSGPA